MKHLKLQSEHYKVLIKSYEHWLDILGYAETTVYNLPNHLQEFFYFLEQKGICKYQSHYSKDHKGLLQLSARAKQRKTKRSIKQKLS